MFVVLRSVLLQNTMKIMWNHNLAPCKKTVVPLAIYQIYIREKEFDNSHKNNTLNISIKIFIHVKKKFW